MKPKPLKQKSKARVCVNGYLKWLGDHGYFARQTVMGDVVIIYAQKAGKPFAICTGAGAHPDKAGTLKEFELTGGRALYVRNIEDLENFLTMGVLV